MQQSLRVRPIWLSVVGQIDRHHPTHEATSELEGTTSEEGAALDSGATELDSGA